jgi:enoyl-CoA hydratase/carnithine racemase
MTPEHLLVDRDGRVVTIVINRPAVLNALSSGTLEQLDAALAAAAEDDQVGAIVLTGAGDRAFAAGADVRELASYSPFAARDH